MIDLKAPPEFVLAVGTFFILLGILIIVFRAQFNSWFGREQTRLFGKLGAALSKRSKPAALIAPGIALLLLGTFSAIVGLAAILN